MFVEANPETLQGGLVGYDNARGARAGAKPCMCSHKFGRDHRSEDRFAVAYLPSRALGSDDREREGLPLLNASPPFPRHRCSPFDLHLLNTGAGTEATLHAANLAKSGR